MVGVVDIAGGIIKPSTIEIRRFGIDVRINRLWRLNVRVVDPPLLMIAFSQGEGI